MSFPQSLGGNPVNRKMDSGLRIAGMTVKKEVHL